MGSKHSLCSRKAQNPNNPTSTNSIGSTNFGSNSLDGTRRANAQPVKLTIGSTEFQITNYLRKTKHITTMVALAPGANKVIIKVYTVRPDVKVDMEILEKMIAISNGWENECLVKYESVHFHPATNEIFLISEYFGSTFQNLKESKLRTIPQVKKALFQVLSTLKFLIADKEIKNVNLKPSNILGKSNNTIVLRDYIANDYLHYLVHGDSPASADNQSQTLFSHDNDLEAFFQVMQEFYKITSGSVPVTALGKNYIEFLVLLKQEKKKPPKEIQFDALLLHSYFWEEDSTSVQKLRERQTEAGNQKVSPRDNATPKMISEVASKKAMLLQESQNDFTVLAYKIIEDTNKSRHKTVEVELKEWIKKSTNVNSQQPYQQPPPSDQPLLASIVDNPILQKENEILMMMAQAQMKS